MRKTLLLLVLAAMILSISAQAATIYGSLPDDGIYLEQSKKHTCTLISAAMMLRNYAFQYGNDYEGITAEAVARVCWSDYGLAHSFKLGDTAVTHDKENFRSEG